MIDNHAVSEIEYRNESWNSQVVLISLKQVDGRNYVDVRKWHGYGGQLVASKGMMLRFDDWIPIMKHIQATIDANKQ